MKVKRDIVVRDQPRSGGPGEQLVELRGHLSLVIMDRKDRGEIIASGAGGLWPLGAEGP